MSAVSIRVIPASSAAWIVAMDCDSSGISLSLFDDIGMAPRPMAGTVNGPKEVVCMAETYLGEAWRSDDRLVVPGSPVGPRDEEELDRQSAGELAYGIKPLPAELVDLRTNQRCQLAVKRQPQHMVSEGRVAGQHRAMRIGPDHSARDGSLRAVVSVSDTDLDSCQRPGLRSEPPV